MARLLPWLLAVLLPALLPAAPQEPLPTFRSHGGSGGLRIWECVHGPDHDFVLVVLFDGGTRTESPREGGFTSRVCRSLIERRPDPAGAGLSISHSVAPDCVAFTFSAPRDRWRTVATVAAAMLALEADSPLRPPGSAASRPADPLLASLRGDPPADPGEDGIPGEAELREFYRTRFTRDRALLAWSGAVPAREAAAHIQTAFAALAEPSGVASSPRLSELPQAFGEALPGEADDGTNLLIGFQFRCQKPEHYLALLVMEQALPVLRRQAAVREQHDLSALRIYRDVNRLGTPFLAAAAEMRDARPSPQLASDLEDVFDRLRTLDESEFEEFRAAAVRAWSPDGPERLTALAVEGLRLSRLGDGRAFDVAAGLKQLRYAHYRETAAQNLSPGHRLASAPEGPPGPGLFLAVYGLAVLLVLLLLADAWLGWRLLRHLRAPLRRDPRAPLRERRPDTEELVRQIQSWYLEQDRLRGRPDHRD